MTAIRNLNVSSERNPAVRRSLGLVLVASLLLVACSGAAMFYQRLHWWAERYVTDYVDFSSLQEAQFQKAFHRFHLSHCRDHLPEYDQWLTQIGQRAGEGRLSYEFLSEMRTNVRGEWDRLAAMAAVEAVALMRSFSQEQIEQLEDGFVEANREYLKYRGETADEARKLRREMMLDRLEYWLGGLSDAQLAAVDDWADSWEPDEQQALAMRVRWQADVLNLLERGQGGDDVSDQLYFALVGYRNYRSADYRALRSRNEELTLRFLAGVTTELSPKQIDHLGDVVELWKKRIAAVDCSRLPAI